MTGASPQVATGGNACLYKYVLPALIRNFSLVSELTGRISSISFMRTWAGSASKRVAAAPYYGSFVA